MHALHEFISKPSGSQRNNRPQQADRPDRLGVRMLFFLSDGGSEHLLAVFNEADEDNDA
jgi:hypothetical protein